MPDGGRRWSLTSRATVHRYVKRRGTITTTDRSADVPAGARTGQRSGHLTTHHYTILNMHTVWSTLWNTMHHRTVRHRTLSILNNCRHQSKTSTNEYHFPETCQGHSQRWRCLIAVDYVLTQNIKIDIKTHIDPVSHVTTCHRIVLCTHNLTDS